MMPSSSHFLRFSIGVLAFAVATVAPAGPPPVAMQEVVPPSREPDNQGTDAPFLRGGVEPRRGEGGGQRFGDREGSARQMMSRRWRNPSDEDMTVFIEVVGELNPTWRDSLVQLRLDDPEAFRRTIAANGRRLWQLVELRESNPDLYELRIKEIQTQGRLRELGQAYRLAVEEGRDDEAQELLAQVEKTATMQVDIQMRVRGEELAAMADALERLRKDLLEQATDRKERARLIVERVIAPRPEGDYAGDRPPGAGSGLGSGARLPRGLQENDKRSHEGDHVPPVIAPDPPAGS